MKHKTKKEKVGLDLDGDGDFDSDDKTLAAKALATGIEKGSEAVKEVAQELEVKEALPRGRTAKVDINLTYRKGDVVPESQIEQWKTCGIEYEQWF